MKSPKGLLRATNNGADGEGGNRVKKSPKKEEERVRSRKKKKRGGGRSNGSVRTTDDGRQVTRITRTTTTFRLRFRSVVLEAVVVCHFSLFFRVRKGPYRLWQRPALFRFRRRYRQEKGGSLAAFQPKRAPLQPECLGGLASFSDPGGSRGIVVLAHLTIVSLRGQFKNVAGQPIEKRRPLHPAGHPVALVSILWPRCSTRSITRLMLRLGITMVAPVHLSSAYRRVTITPSRRPL